MLIAKKLRNVRDDIVKIFHAGVKEVDAGVCIRRACVLKGNILTIIGKEFDLEKFDKTFVVGAGKATAGMAFELENILGDKINSGLISVKYEHTAELKYIEIIEAGHPVPDRNGNIAAEKIIRIAEKATKDDLMICLISGGGSALLPLPVSGISFDDKQALTRVLLLCGADIHEINIFRKNLSEIKGGGLARAGAPATIISLMISDVIGNDPGVIASGPTIPYFGEIDKCLGLIEKYNIINRIPKSVVEYLHLGLQKKGDRTSHSDQNISNFIIGDSETALLSAEKKAKSLGYHSLIYSSAIEGDTKDAAALHCNLAREIADFEKPLKKPACILSGGETTVVVSGSGLGGRNMEFALCAALGIANNIKITILSGGTDGTDGPTDAAGAIADSDTVNRAKKAGLDPDSYLKENNSYNFFDSLNDLLITGPTNTNVMDLRIMLIA